MTLTIDLTPVEEMSLGMIARHNGLNLIEAAHQTLAAGLPYVTNGSQERLLLLEERATLLDCEFAGTLSNAQAARLHQVEVLLDQIEDQDPVEREADRRLAQTGDKLDEILTLLRSLPRRTSEDTH